MSGSIRFLGGARSALAALSRGWTRLWFDSRTTTPLEISRIGVGAALFVNYALATPYLFEFWADDGPIPREVFSDFGALTLNQSLLFFTRGHAQLVIFHAVFLLCCIAFTIGWRTSWVKWLVMIGQLSYVHRNPVVTYGAEQIMASLLVILCVAEIGHAYSLDRVREVRAAKRKNVNSMPPHFRSAWACACTRLMQIQMAILFLYTGMHKVRGTEWWNGDAVWHVFTKEENYSWIVLYVLATHYWLVNLVSYVTIVVEIGYPFLIWQHRTRPYLLVAAFFLHLNIAVFMGLYYFAFVMSMGHVSFIRPIWLTQCGSWWKRKTGKMEMIYDASCASRKSSLIWFLAFDGLQQINARDFRERPSRIVKNRKLEKEPYLILPDGRTLLGFDGYRYAVLRVPGLWWLVPILYFPLLGRLAYSSIAAKPRRLS